MKKIAANEAAAYSADILSENIAQLSALFPEAFTEGKIDFEVLKQLLGGAVDEREEKYGLNWHGKRRARQLALTPSTGTLRPCPADSVDWDTTQNLMIEGDNLEVLKLLQKSYAGKVKLIYIDPPYNTGKDFVYPDNFHDNIKNYLELTGQTGEGGKKLSSNTEASGRFHTDWLNMMYPRLKLARNLLCEDGVMFVSIDDKEQGNLRKLCDEIFGEENFLCQFVWKKGGTGKNDSQFAVVEHEYVVGYARSYDLARFEYDDEGTVTTSYNLEDEVGRYSLVRLDMQSLQYSKSLDYDLVGPDGRVYKLAHKNNSQPNATWRWSMERVSKEMAELVFKDGNVYTKNYAKDGAKVRTLLANERFGVTRTGGAEAEVVIGEPGVFDFPKPVRLIRFLVRIVNCEDSVVLDFFAGSGTTGHAVFEQNALDGVARKFIVVQLPELLDSANKDQRLAADFCDKLGKPRTIAELTKERLRRAGKKIKEENPLFAGDLGFRVFKLDSTNIREWDPDRDKLAETLEASIEHLKTDRTEQDILFELLLKLGLDLCVPIEQKKIAGKDVYSIGGGVLLVCLPEKIKRAEVEALALGIVAWHKALAPAGDSTCVFRDSAFADDVAKTNLSAILQQHGLGIVRSL